MQYAVTCTLPLLVALSAHAQLQPFTLTQTEGPTSGPTRTILTTQAANGSRAAYQESPGSELTALSPRTVTLPGEGIRALITDELKLISTYYLTPSEITALKTPKSSPVCDPGSGAKLAAQDHFFGVLALRYESLLRGGAEKHSHWYAPSLNCFTLQYEVHTLESGGWKPIFARVPARLDLIAASTSHFLVLSSYREVPPSEHQKAAIALKRGTPFGSEPNDAALENTLRRLDRHYHESQQFKPHQ